MKKMQEEIKNRLLFDGVIDHSFEFNSKSIKEIDLVSSNRKKFSILTGPDLERNFQDVEEIIVIIYVGNDSECSVSSEEILNEINLKYKDIESTKEYLGIKEKSEVFNIRLYFMFNNLGSRYNFESAYDNQKCFYLSNLRNKLKFISNLDNFKSRNFIVTYDYISLKKDSLNYRPKIGVLSRVQINRFDSFTSELFGYTFTAKLRDLVSVFEVKSNNLFKDNVRYGIGENNSVDFNIIKTLTENPCEFWYLNNGITIFTESTIDIKSSQYLMLDNDTFSVVNGAQTITSATKFFFSNIDKKILKHAEENAYVVLKVIEGNRSYVNNITVSLNRQKPIYIEDIEYFSNGVASLNQFTADSHSEVDKSLRFQIVRKGEATSPYNSCYGLPSIARMITAISFNNPGFARSGGLTQILKHKIFPEEVTLEVFMDNYWYINNAMKLQAELLDYVKRVNFLESEQIKETMRNEFSAVLQYGQYHMISSFVKAFLIKGSLTNDDIINKINESIFKQMVYITHDFWLDYFASEKSTKNIWDSNMFKNIQNGETLVEKLSEMFKDKIII